MNFSTYVEEKKEAKTRGGEIKVAASINKRWQERVVAQRLDLNGGQGAVDYLSRYGNNISAAKVIDLALCAAAHGNHEMSEVFFARAYEIETGNLPEAGAEIDEIAASLVPSKIAQSVNLPSLPSHLQPGKIITMQPVDAPDDMTREDYIKSYIHYGQPKRDGIRLVVIKADGQVFYQSRSTKLQAVPSVEFDEAIKAASYKTFVLDGELYYVSASGKEHRTAAQAASQNVIDGVPDAPVQQRYGIFKALYAVDYDLTTADETARYRAAIMIQAALGSYSNIFELVPLAVTEDEKRDLVERQQLNGREGEIWIKSNCQYVGGKDKRNLPIVRTKYLQEVVAWVVGLTPTTADGRLFGAIEVAANPDGSGELGKVGTGFDAATQAEVVKRFESGPFQVEVQAQGRTETGKLWHARLHKILR